MVPIRGLWALRSEVSPIFTLQGYGSTRWFYWINWQPEERMNEDMKNTHLHVCQKEHVVQTLIQADLWWTIHRQPRLTIRIHPERESLGVKHRGFVVLTLPFRVCVCVCMCVSNYLTTLTTWYPLSEYTHLLLLVWMLVTWRTLRNVAVSGVTPWLLSWRNSRRKWESIWIVYKPRGLESDF